LSSSPIPTYDTSAGPLAAKLADGTFGDGDGQADPGPDDIYTMRLAPGLSTRLVALHITTKELRDWFWITLFWSDQPDSDFGADRPARLDAGPFRNYKMCVTTAYEENDPAPGASFEAAHPSLAASLSAAAAHGPATWCSNPYLETAEHAARTNCIGCHQHGGTNETSDTVLQNPAAFPDSGRKKVRDNFPVDYAFSTHGALDLAADMRVRIEALTPPDPRAPR
jgi:cytochrome c553